MSTTNHPETTKGLSFLIPPAFSCYVENEMTLQVQGMSHVIIADDGFYLMHCVEDDKVPVYMYVCVYEHYIQWSLSRKDIV